MLNAFVIDETFLANLDSGADIWLIAAFVRIGMGRSRKYANAIYAAYGKITSEFQHQLLLFFFFFFLLAFIE